MVKTPYVQTGSSVKRMPTERFIRNFDHGSYALPGPKKYVKEEPKTAKEEHAGKQLLLFWVLVSPLLNSKPESLLKQKPRGSKYPIFGVSGSRNHTLDGIWDQSA